VKSGAGSCRCARVVEEAMGPSDCQTRHARTGAKGPLDGGAMLSLGELTPRGATRGYSRPSAAVTHRRQRVAVRPSALPHGDPLGHGHTPLPSVCCPL
jgi:hypothetical protein